MNNLLKRALGIVYVVETESAIEIRGVKAQSLARDIMKLWTSKRVERYMFYQIEGKFISFPKFFAPDVHYILMQVHNYKNAYTSKSVIRSALKELEENTWLKNITEDKPDILDLSVAIPKFKKTPLPHQMKFFEAFNYRIPRYGLQGYLLSAGAGTGKTFTGLVLAEALKADVVVMVVPKNAVYRVWEAHLKDEYKTPQESWVIADGQPYKGQRFIIAHFEALDKARAVVSSKGGLVVVILDESHNLNQTESLRTQIFIDMCNSLRNKYVLWSSGTPIKALGSEAIPLIKTIDPMFTKDVEERFKKIYAGDSSRALDILRNRLGMLSYRVESSAVVDNKTSSKEIKIKVPGGDRFTLDAIRIEMQKFITERLKFYRDNRKTYTKSYDECLAVFEKAYIKTSEQAKAFKVYKQYVAMISKGFDPKNMANEARYCNSYERGTILPNLPDAMKKDFRAAKSVVKYPELKVLGEALGGVLGKKRVECQLEMIKGTDFKGIIEKAAKKTIVFSSYVPVTNAVAEEVKKGGFKPVLVHAQVDGTLPALVGQFEKDPDANPLVATFQSLSTAVPLIMANTTIFTNVPFRDHELVQAKARTNRLGQDTEVEYFYTYLDTGSKPNISTRSQEILQWSREQVGAILGQDYSGEVTPDLLTTVESIQEHLDDDMDRALNHRVTISEEVVVNYFEAAPAY